MKPDSTVDWSVKWACCTEEGKREDSFHTPTGSLQWTSGGERRTDEITSPDPCNETRFFYRLYARVRVVPYKTPEIKRR